MVAGADALVHDHADGDQLLVQLPGEVVGDGLAHAEKDAGGAKLIDVVEDMGGVDGGQVRDEHAGVEGAQVDDGPGQKPEVVQKPGRPHDELWQQGHGEHEGREPVRGVPVHRLAVSGDQVVDLVVDGEHVVPRLEKDLDRGLDPVALGVVFQHHKADAEVVAVVDPASDDKAVDVGVLEGGQVVGGDDHRHAAHPHPLLLLHRADVVLDDLLIHVFRHIVLSVHPLGHNVGDGLLDGGQPFGPAAIRSHGWVLLFTKR